MNGCDTLFGKSKSTVLINKQIKNKLRKTQIVICFQSKLSLHNTTY